jgi:hypothetical protein
LDEQQVRRTRPIVAAADIAVRVAGAPSASEASSQFLWWPAEKVAGRHLARYLGSLPTRPS